MSLWQKQYYVGLFLVFYFVLSFPYTFKILSLLYIGYSFFLYTHFLEARDSILPPPFKNKKQLFQGFFGQIFI